MNPGSIILDVGCGPGVKSKYLINEGMKVVGIDFSEKMIEITRKEIPQAEFKVLDLFDLSDLKKSFEAIFSQAVFLHFSKKDKKEVIKNLYQRLETGGYFYVAVKRKDPGEKDEEIIEDKIDGKVYQRYFSYYTLDEIKKCLLDTGLKIEHENIIDSDDNCWIQLIGRKI